MSEDLVPASPPAPDPRVGARDRLFVLIDRVAMLPGVPLPLRAVVASARPMAQFMVRSDEDALALSEGLRILCGLFIDYVNGLQPDVEAADRVLDELAQRFER